jgi:2-keto-3-deoxy-L-rhamnonate aldolase RhmA
MQPAKELKAKVNRGELTTGVLVIDHLWPALMDHAIQAGMDYMIVCMEHSCHNPERVAEMCALGRRADFPVLVRPPQLDFSTISKTMDLGACGMLLPTVESEAQMDVVRDATRVPPNGRRRPGGMGNRWIKDMTAANWAEEVEEDIIILPQIESAKGLENLDAIVGHEITTCAAIGPYDLSHDLGVGAQWDNPKYLEGREQIREAAKRAGKVMWMIGDGAQLAGEGFTFLCVGEPSVLLESAMTNVVKQTRGQASEDSLRGYNA